MNKELVVASEGCTPIRYTSTGTVRMEPPLPTMPSDRPMSMEAIYPRISIIVCVK
jgi:hypothetical protein